MSAQGTKPNLKASDQFLRALNLAFDWCVDHAAAIVGVILLAALVGGGAAVWSQIALSREEAVQEKYFLVEKRMLDLQRGFEESAQQARLQAAAAKTGKPAPPAEAPVGAPATGDLAKDYGTIPEELEKIIEASPNSKAAGMAALNLADLRARHGQMDAAVEVISKVNTKNGTSDLVSALVVNRKASLLADKGDCQTAVGLWEKVTKDASAKFLHGESKLRMGLCYETMNEPARAEQLYTEITSQEGDPAAIQDAQRYLRLLKAKQSTRGS